MNFFGLRYLLIQNEIGWEVACRVTISFTIHTITRDEEMFSMQRQQIDLVFEGLTTGDGGFSFSLPELCKK